MYLDVDYWCLYYSFFTVKPSLMTNTTQIKYIFSFLCNRISRRNTNKKLIFLSPFKHLIYFTATPKRQICTSSCAIPLVSATEMSLCWGIASAAVSPSTPAASAEFASAAALSAALGASRISTRITLKWVISWKINTYLNGGQNM